MPKLTIELEMSGNMDRRKTNNILASLHADIHDLLMHSKDNHLQIAHADYGVAYLATIKIDEKYINEKLGK